jgi:2-oxoisovalerate dehydrogenase E1 component beta subunit
MISYGAYVHHCMRVAEKLSAEALRPRCSTCAASRRSIRTRSRGDASLQSCADRARGLEDRRIGESLAAIIQEEAFESLDAPIRILGALDTPVPYSPPLEEFFLVGEDDILKSARLLAGY